MGGSSVLLVPKHGPLGPTSPSSPCVPGRSRWPGRAANERPGEYGLEGAGIHAIVGPLVAESSGSVTRRLQQSSGGLRAGARVAVDTNVLAGDPMQALGIPFQDVSVPGQLGSMPAWLVPGSAAPWAIFVHGVDGDRGGGLRVLPALHALGLPALLITYRNDVGAPRSPDGLIHLGMTECRFLRLSPLASRVSRVVLDAPALDWQSILARPTVCTSRSWPGPPSWRSSCGSGSTGRA